MSIAIYLLTFLLLIIGIYAVVAKKKHHQDYHRVVDYRLCGKLASGFGWISHGGTGSDSESGRIGRTTCRHRGRSLTAGNGSDEHCHRVGFNCPDGGHGD